MNKTPTVLYVEDDLQSRKLMVMLLQGRLKLPHLTIFEDSTDFLNRVRSLDPKPDVMFLDIHMQPYNGFEMLAMLRQLDWTQGRPIVAITASVMSEEVQRLKSAGFNGCLAKPLNLATFPGIFSSILRGDCVWRITD